MKVFVIMLYYLLVNAAEKKPLLTPLKSFTYQATAKNYINNLNSLLWGLRIDADRKASLFGAVILPSYDGTAIIVSAPGRKPVTGTYGGDVFICTIADFPNACISMTHFTTPAKIGIPSFHVPLLFGAHLLRMDDNHVLVCQIYRGFSDIGFFKHCQCLKDTTNTFVDNGQCLVTQHHQDAPITFLNVFQMKFNSDKKWIILGSRHFHASFIIPGTAAKAEKALNFDSEIAIWELDTAAEIKQRFSIKLKENKDWIPTVGFDIGILFPQKTVRTNTEGTASEVVDTGAASAGITDVDDAKTEGLVVATNDDDAQKGRLFIYKFPLDHELAIPHLTISDDNDWQPFANFGNKIIIMDINKDGKNDLLVTAPTSKWNDLPEVGHVHLFMNTGSDPFSNSKSLIIRGEPIAHSFFGWNAESAGDLDGDGVNDFLVVALKVDDEGKAGGVYVFLGRDDSCIHELAYHTIIKDEYSPDENSQSGFGFFLSTKMNLAGNTDNDLAISRIYDGEIDVFTITPNPDMIKVSVFIEPNHFMMDENFITSLFSKNVTNPEITIRFKYTIKTLFADIKLSFIHSSNSHSFDPDYPLDTLVIRKTLTPGCDLKYTVHLLPSYEKISLKWILRAEITLKDVNEQGKVNEDSNVFHGIFYPEISFEKRCREDICVDDYTVEPQNTPTWSQSTNDPISFTFQLTNKGDFLAHLMIDATISMDCKINITDSGFTQVLKSIPVSLDVVKSQARFLYNKVTSPGAILPFTVHASCPQVMERTSGPVLIISVKSFLPDNLKEVTVKTVAKRKTELLISTKISPSISKQVYRGLEVEENVDFNVELFVDGYHDNDIQFSAILNLDDAGSTRVVAIHIKSNETQVHTEDGLLQDHHDRVIQKFNIRKDEKVKRIQLFISYKMVIKTSNDMPLTLKIEPVIEEANKYWQNPIMANEAE